VKKPNHYTVLSRPGSNVHSRRAVLWLEGVENVLVYWLEKLERKSGDKSVLYSVVTSLRVLVFLKENLSDGYVVG